MQLGRARWGGLKTGRGVDSAPDPGFIVPSRLGAADKVDLEKERSDRLARALDC